MAWQSIHQCLVSPASSNVTAKWEKPPPGWLKLNSDADLNSSTRITTSGDAIRWAKEKGVTAVQVEFDSQLVAQGLLQSNDNSSFDLIVKDIHEIASTIPSISFRFVKRYANSVAHLFARDAVFNAGCREWDFLPPPFVLDVLLAEASDLTLANSAAATRRLQFLLRCLGGYAGKAKNCGYQNTIRMQSVVSIGAGLEVDAVSVLRSITPNLDLTKHKGQAGKIAVVGGCREYTGAPYFSAISALKIGADLSHVFCTKDAAPVIKSYSPELIVHPILEESYSIRDEDKSSISAKVIAEVDKWMERFDCLVIGPGLGRDPFLLDCVSNIIKHARDCDVPMVIDGDGLFLVTNCLDLVRGYPLAVLTPNINEYKRLVQSVLNSEVNDENGTEQLKSLVNGIGGVTILRKGKSDLISDGKTVSSVSIYGSPRRCGGQGDILSGSVAVFLCWARQQAAAKGESVTNPTILGCIAGSVLLRNAAALAFKNKRRSTLTGDIIECLGQSLEEICPVL
nr:ATP-dependent (S)-NAD(P)H-hydrate dehydratase [Ipomoea batatas]